MRSREVIKSGNRYVCDVFAGKMKKTKKMALSSKVDAEHRNAVC